jgi:stearoyl-CoA desaturase (delta-9 desaturase)
MQAKKHINWTTTLFFTLTPLIALFGTIYTVSAHGLPSATLLLAFAFIIATGLAITAGYHRLFSHKTYKASWPIRLLYVLFGSAAFEGSVLEWCTDHRNHHLYTDQEKDPYNINKGLWYAHIGWIFTLDESKRDFSNVNDLMADPIVAFQHKYNIPLSIAMCFLLPMGIASLWGDAWGGLFIAGALRLTLNQHFTFCINSICHYFGKQTYSDRISARDNWLFSLFTYGEGFHNFHHQFAADYRNGVRLYHFDPSKWLIRGLSFIGLAHNLRRVDANLIIKYRLDMEEKRLRESNKYSAHHYEEVLLPIRTHITKLQTQIEKLKHEYQELKLSKLNYMKDQIEDYKKSIGHYRQNLKDAKKEFKYALKTWKLIVRTMPV